LSRKNDITSITKILSLLATHPEVYQSEIEGKTKLSNKTIIENLKRLESNKLVTHRTEPSSMGGKDKKIWRITYQGIASVLKNAKSVNEVTVIAKKHPDLLLVFKKWDLLEKTGVLDLVWNELKLSLDLQFVDDNEQLASMGKTYLPNKLDDALFYALVQALQSGADENDPFVILCKTDEEIKAFLNGVLLMQEKGVEQTQKSISLIRATIGK
jgi:DNA-binding PadR family transcriptional regulator